MYARVATAKIVPGKADELTAKLKDVAIPAYETQPGFGGAMVLIDRENETGIMLTLWETEDALQVSESQATHRPQLDDVRHSASVAFYEVTAKTS